MEEPKSGPFFHLKQVCLKVFLKLGSYIPLFFQLKGVSKSFSFEVLFSRSIKTF